MFSVESTAVPSVPKSGPLAVRSLARNERLFRAGEVKTNLYRVESGAVCIYATRPDLTLELIEVAGAGEVVGLGMIETHATNARAVVDTTVACYPVSDADRLLPKDDRTAARIADAVDREFTFLRQTRVEEGVGKPLVRLAAFLVTVSRQNALEGRDPTMIDDTLNCAVIADHLGMRLDVLALTLMQLESRGLVQPALDHGLRLLDIASLEALTSDTAEAATFDILDATPAACLELEAMAVSEDAGDADGDIVVRSTVHEAKAEVESGLSADDAEEDLEPVEPLVVAPREGPLVYAREASHGDVNSGADPQRNAMIVCIAAASAAAAFVVAYGGLGI